MSTRSKYRWLHVPLLAGSLYIVLSRQFPPDGFWAQLLTLVVVATFWLGYWILAFPVITKVALQLTRKGPPPLPRKQTLSVEDRLDELERLKRRDMVTPEEYAAKRQEILKDL